MIEAHELTKRYGRTTAVQTLSFTIAPGTVTGFLGPNGAGKSTTMRLIMGLDRPASGTVTVNGKPYGQHRSQLPEVGALLDAKAVHLGRSARSHLRTMAATHNIKNSRVSEVIEMTGLAGAATQRVGGFSLGMSQRLGIAAALFSLGICTLLRSTAASLTATLTVLLLPGALSFIRLDWVETIVSYLPLPASSALLTTGAAETHGAYLSAQASLIVMAAYAVVPLAAAAVTLHRRDA